MTSDTQPLFFDRIAIRYSKLSYTNKSRLTAALVLAVCLVGASVSAADAPREDLVIHASGFAHDGGQAVASLFREADDVFGKPSARVMAKVHQGKATLAFARLQHGNYAVIVFHDENGNNDLDHNFLRMPAEPLGFSNGFQLTLFSGLPNFERLRFAFGAGAKPVEISVK